MTRRTLIATLLAAILEPFRRAKAAPVVKWDKWSEIDAAWRGAPVYRWDSTPKGAPNQPAPIGRVGRLKARILAKFGLCAKCGGLTCVCD